MPSETDKVLVARRPIFDAKRTIWGYEMVFRRCGDKGCDLVEKADERTAETLGRSLDMGMKGLAGGKKLCIRITLMDVLERLTDELPPQSVIWVLPEGKELHIGRQTWLGLKGEGYSLALPYAGEHNAQTMKMADMAVIDVHEHEPDEVRQWVAELSKTSCTLMAANIRNWEAFQAAKKQGFQLFKGEFFTQPEIAPGKKMASGVATRLRLLKALNDPDAGIDDIVGVIASDTPLSYRLLKYINSPAFSLSKEVSSIRHAAVLLGLRPLRTWAMVAVVADMDGSEKGVEVSWRALHKAFFLKLLSENGYAPGWDPEAFFLVGLFSNIDAILGLPMKDVLKDLPLAPELKKALLGKDAVYSAWDQVIQELEFSHMETVRDMLVKLKAPAGKAAQMYMQATVKASEASNMED